MIVSLMISFLEVAALNGEPGEAAHEKSIKTATTFSCHGIAAGPVKPNE
jgi:hypothetical protein